MKKILMLLIVSVLVVGMTTSVSAMTITGDPIEGNSWSQAFGTDYKPNLFNLWSDHPFEKATGLPSGWTYYQSSDGLFAQMFTTGAYGISNLTYSQFWQGSKPSSLYLDWQECHYDWSTGTIDASWQGGLKGYWSVVSYGNAGGPANCPPPVPIPTTMLLLGSGLLGLVGIKRKFRKR